MDVKRRFVMVIAGMLLGYVGAILGSSPIYCEENKAADDSPTDERRLLRRVKVDFDDEPLENVLQKLADQAGLKLVINTEHLAKEGIAPDTPVSIELSREISIRSTLILILDDLQMRHKVDDGKLHIVSKVVNPSARMTKYYLAVRFKMSPKESKELAARVRSTVEPNSWKANGGKMWLRLSDDAKVMTVFNTHDTIDRVTDLVFEVGDGKLKAARAAALASTEQRAARPAAELKRTDVLPHAAGEIQRGRNYVYQVATQLAWNSLREQVGGPVKLEVDPPLAGVLNLSEFNSTDVSSDAYVAAAGTIEDGVIDKIRRQMRDKFPHKQVGLPQIKDENALLLFAYLYKRLAFRDDFDRLEEPLKFRSQAGIRKVASFGIEKVVAPEPLITQVAIHDYRNDDDFIIEPETKSESDELVLAKVAPSKTLAATIQSVQQRIEKEDRPPDLCDGDSLVVPIIDINVGAQNDEFRGRRLVNEGWRERYIAKALATVRFRLDEKGVTLEESRSPVGRSMEKPKPRHLVFDKPFLILTKQRKADSPYFAMWVENDEVMEKFPQKE